MLTAVIKENFDELSGLLKQISAHEYAKPWHELSQASIGQHIRHVIEMHRCLQNAYLSGYIEYDKRERDPLLQNCPEAALLALTELRALLDKPNKPMKLNSDIDGLAFEIDTNYERELLYNLEHSIHHQALIKVAVRHCEATVGDDFGVAKSTLAFRKQCAQ